MPTLTTRRVRRARRFIAKEACSAKWGIRHRWAPMSGLSGAGLFVRCINCGRVE